MANHRNAPETIRTTLRAAFENPEEVAMMKADVRLRSDTERNEGIGSEKRGSPMDEMTGYPKLWKRLTSRSELLHHAMKEYWGASEPVHV